VLQQDLVRKAVRLSRRADRVQAALWPDWFARGPADEARRRGEEAADLERQFVREGRTA
jgi:hypothetical protein